MSCTFERSRRSPKSLVWGPAGGGDLKGIGVGEKQESMLFDPTSAKIMAFNADSSTVSVIDPASQAIAGTIKLPHPPENAQTDGRGHVYVNFEEGNAVGVIDTKKMAFDHLITLTACDGPAPLAVDKTSHRLFSGSRTKLMAVAPAERGKVVGSAALGGESAAGASVSCA